MRTGRVRNDPPAGDHVQCARRRPDQQKDHVLKPALHRLSILLIPMDNFQGSQESTRCRSRPSAFQVPRSMGVLPKPEVACRARLSTVPSWTRWHRSSISGPSLPPPLVRHARLACPTKSRPPARLACPANFIRPESTFFLVLEASGVQRSATPERKGTVYFLSGAGKASGPQRSPHRKKVDCPLFSAPFFPPAQDRPLRTLPAPFARIFLAQVHRKLALHPKAY